MIDNILEHYNVYVSFLSKVAQFYTYCLRKDLNIFTYCNTDRHITEESISKFQIGYAPGYFKLQQFVTMNHLDENLLFETGICKESDTGQVYDRFTHRLVFPIYDLHGNVVSFSGRLPQERPGTAKYINGPETSVFSKSFTVYGLYQALNGQNKVNYLLVVEGNIDVVTAHQSGLQYTVAPLGTSLTDEQLLLIQSCTDKIIFCFDEDMAGKNAGVRAAEMCKQHRIENFEFLSLSGAKDIDSYIVKFGSESIEKALNEITNRRER